MVINKWPWNCNAREAAKMLMNEVTAGRGGSKREWAMEVEAELSVRDSQAVLALIGQLD